MGAAATMKSDTLQVPGAKLYYEVRGSGPVLLFMPGGPADATTFRKMEGRLARDYTVVTYDPRTYSHSELEEPVDDARMVELFADDVHLLLEHLGADGACVFASSGGAVIALDLVKRHPEHIATLIAHEPPCPDFVADTARVRAEMVDVCDTCEKEGVWPAMQKFMKLVGVEGEPPPPDQGEPTPEQVEAQAMMQKNFGYFFSRYIRNIALYRPDVEALRASSCRIVAGVGTSSKGQLAREGGLGLARALGTEAAVFPGGHGGFDECPDDFAARIHEVLEG